MLYLCVCLYNIFVGRYHGGAFVGNDCERLLQYKTRHAIAQSLKRRKFNVGNNTYQQYGNDVDAQKAHTLLTKIYHIDKLFSIARPLCRHEVALFCMRVYSYGNWFPVRFPSQHIIPKMHLMIYEMSRFVNTHQTIGMFTEQAGESLHNVFNKLNRQYTPIASDIHRLQAIMQKCMLMHDSRIENNKK
jgi:hypothetical protein